MYYVIGAIAAIVLVIAEWVWLAAFLVSLPDEEDGRLP